MARTAIIALAIIIVFGILTPLIKGPDLLNPLLLTAYMILSLVIVGPGAAGVFAGEEAAEGAAGLRRLGLVALYAWALGAIVLAAGLITIRARAHRPLLPRTSFLIAELVCGAAATAFVGLVAGLIARRYSANAARTAQRFVFLGLVIFLFALARFGGPEWVRAIYGWATERRLTNIFVICAVALAVADVPLAAALARRRALQ